MEPLVTILAAVGGLGGLGGLGTGVLALLRARPEARKTDADAAQVLSASAVQYATAVKADLDSLRAELHTYQAKQRARDHAHETQLRKHVRWDDRVAAALRDLGGDIEDPPPLYPTGGA